MFETNYLLTISRMTEKFYPMVHGLTGRDTMYKNPGFSLRSYVVAKCISKEFTHLDGDEGVREVFNRSRCYSEGSRDVVEESNVSDRENFITSYCVSS